MEPMTFDTPGMLTLEVRIPSGGIVVKATDTSVTTLEIRGERDPTTSGSRATSSARGAIGSRSSTAAASCSAGAGRISRRSCGCRSAQTSRPKPDRPTST